MLDLGNPLRKVESRDKDNGAAETNFLLNVVQRIWRVNGETDEDDMRVWVAERTKAVVVFLASRVPQSEFNVFSVNLYICNVVLKNGGDINLVENGIVRLGERKEMLKLTSGKVPFEKTINRQV